MGAAAEATLPLRKPGSLGDLALTLPVFLAYQIGVVFLGVRNAADLVTSHLLELTGGDRTEYLVLTGGIGLALFAFFAIAGRGQVLRVGSLVQILLEGALYAFAMSATASWVVGKLFAGTKHVAPAGPLPGLVMSLGAGFYEEIAFRVLLFGAGARVILWLLRPPASGVARTARGTLGAFAATVGWAVVSAAIFSGMHYVGALGDALDVKSFVARGVLGLALTLVYAARGFAAAVWTHALYDMWVLVF